MTFAKFTSQIWIFFQSWVKNSLNDINDFTDCVQTLVRNVKINEIDVIDIKIDVIILKEIMV